MELNAKKIGELFDRFSSGKALTDENIHEEGLFPVYGGNGLRGYSNVSNFEGECLIVGRQGAKCGNVRFFSGKGYMTDHAIVGVANQYNSARYLTYALAALDLNRLSGQAAQPGLSVSMLKRQKVLVPSLKEQEAIANIIAHYESLIEVNNQRIKLLEQMAESLYKEWFIRFRFPGYENAEFENGIPCSWTIQQLKKYGRVETGKTPSMEIEENYGSEYLFIKTPDMHGNMFVIDTGEKLSEIGHRTQPRKLLPPGSIMVTCIGTGGVVALNAYQGHTNQQINSIIIDDIVVREWLFFTCKNMKSTIEMFGSTGTTMTNLSKGKFERLKVIEPTRDLLEKYNELVSPMFSEIKQLMLANQNLTKQRDLLLPRLMSGKLEVK